MPENQTPFVAMFDILLLIVGAVCFGIAIHQHGLLIGLLVAIAVLLALVIALLYRIIWRQINIRYSLHRWEAVVDRLEQQVSPGVNPNG